MVQQQIVTHASKSITFTAYDIKWVPSSARFVSVGGTARGSGTIKTWSLNNNEISMLSEIESPASFKCATFGGSSIEDRHLTTGDFNGNLAMWDLAAGKGTRQFSGHSEIVNSIDGCGGLKGAGATEIASVSRDGQVKVWDVRQKEAVCSFSEHSSTSQTQEDKKSKVPDCWAVAFGNAYDNTAREVAAGYATGELVIYDLRTRSLRWSHKLPNGICSIQFDRKDIAMNKMIVTTLDGKFYVFDMRTFHSKRGYSYLTQKAHDSTVWTAQHSPFNRDIFISTGGNGAINLYQYTYPSARSSKDSSGEAYGEMGKLTTVAEAQVADQPVISYDWHPDKEGLACGAVLDQTIKIFVAPKLHLL